MRLRLAFPRNEHLGNFGRSQAGLHAKMATPDDRWVFIGSMKHEPHDSAWQRIKFLLMLPLVNQNEL